MSISLTKGDEGVSLTKEVPGLKKVTVGLGWDVSDTPANPFDLDASAIMCGADKKVLGEDYFVFYNSKLKNTDKTSPLYKTIPSPDGSILHTGDNLTGEGEGDDEAINVDLPAVPPECFYIYFSVSIYEADKRKQHFGDVANPYIRVLDVDSGDEIARFDLRDDYPDDTALLLAELYRQGDEWHFGAIGDGYKSGLGGIATDYGVGVK